MFLLSFSLQSYWGGGAFVSGIDEDLIIAITLPVISGVGWAQSIINIITFAIDAVSVFLSVMTFDITGLNWMLRFIIVAPLWIANIYILFAILLDIGVIIADLIPFT